MNAPGVLQGPNPGANHSQGHGQQSSSTQKQPKALRFVTNYGAPHPKRRRVGAACLTCRKRKTACSGERPTCETCKQNKLECAGYSSETPATPGQKKNQANVSGRRLSSESDRGSDKQSKRSTEARSAVSKPNSIEPSFAGSTFDDDGKISWRPSGPSPSGRSSRASNMLRRHPSDIGVEGRASLFPRPRDRMPYFRWLGPTAIMPGFKQMVVKVKRQDTDTITRSSTNGEAPGRLSPSNELNQGSIPRVPCQYPSAAATIDADARSSMSLPFYDNSPMPPSELITHLAHTFFTHLGCNYPFLQRERFLRDLEEKQVDAILVDAVCALAARFSTHPLLTSQTHLPAPGQPTQEEQGKLDKPTPAEYGHVFAQRAKAALVDTFACPSVAVVQAALLLAYLEFGESRDSGLWMYLGISIRMAQDLGLHTIEGLKYKGMGGPTPKIIRRESASDSKKKLIGSASPESSRYKRDRAATIEEEEAVISHEPEESDRNLMQGDRGSKRTIADSHISGDSQIQIEEQKAVEQERMDTFWAVFFLDRVVSSGTGRRSTLRDKDIELSFPSLDEPDQKTGWPAPFPALIRIIHLYGRVADLLNGIKEPSDITPDTSKRLAAMESQVTHFYQGLSPRLHFDAVNFQHYMKAGEGTNFVLLHFWFHTLIVLLHQPTLLKTFEGKMLKLFPNSQQLSMSSAKTIADILSYSQLMDAKASLGNPFTSQPIYIAACAFLKETAEQAVSSAAQSRASSPSRKPISDFRPVSRPESMSGTPQKGPSVFDTPASESATKDSERDTLGDTCVTFKRPSIMPPFSQQISDQPKSNLSKHTLLATAATQHYQLCYKALQSLETYWAGAKYILTILNQKFEGVEDPLLYTAEESESSMERPRPVPEFKSPGWRRKLIWDPSIPGAYLAGTGVGGIELTQSPFWKARRASLGEGDPSKAIGWTLTGTMNSPSTQLAWHFPSGTAGVVQGQQAPNVQPFDTSTAPTFPSPSITRQEQSVQRYAQHNRGISVANAHPGQAEQHLSQLGPRARPTAGSGMSNQDAAGILLGLNNPYQMFRNVSPPSTNFPPQSAPHNNLQPQPGSGIDTGGQHVNFDDSSAHMNTSWIANADAMQPFGDMMIESQDVDMSMLGLDMMPWFDSYPTHDMTGMLDPNTLGAAESGAGNGRHGSINMNASGHSNVQGAPGSR